EFDGHRLVQLLIVPLRRQEESLRLLPFAIQLRPHGKALQADLLSNEATERIAATEERLETESRVTSLRFGTKLPRVPAGARQGEDQRQDDPADRQGSSAEFVSPNRPEGHASRHGANDGDHGDPREQKSQRSKGTEDRRPDRQGREP